MKATRLAAVVVVGALVALTACAQGAGPVVDESREVGAFAGIEAGGGVQVHVTIGQTAPIVVHAQENIQDKISTEVRSDGTLRIEARDDFVVADPVVVEVSTPELTSISLSGGAAVQLSDLEASALAVSLSGGARATISGTVTEITLAARGGATALLGGVTVEMARVDLDGGASAEMHVTGSVTGSASGGATLQVSGEASVQVDTSGGAEVSHG
jgi:hypothetical protein